MNKKVIPRYYKCYLDGTHWWRTYAASAGQAKQAYIRMLDGCADDCYLSILCRVDSPKTTQAFKDNAKYRGIPFAYVGMNVKIRGDKGIIVGHNSSANLDIYFLEGDFFLRRSEAKATYKAGNLALKYLLKIAPEDCTLKDVDFLLEKFRKTHKIEKEE